MATFHVFKPFDERTDHTFQPTALVHEAYVRLSADCNGLTKNKAYFMAAAARAMRQILVAHARKKSAAKRGGGWTRLSLDDIAGSFSKDALDIYNLDCALKKLASDHERSSHVVELRFFGGFKVNEAALVMGVSPRTIELDWRFARAWLINELALGAT